MIELRSGGSVLHLLPELGGAVASWRRAGADVLHPVSDPNLIAQHERPVAAYPLIPFSNRVAYGTFEFDGRTYRLAQNFGGEPHTTHGNAWEREWRVAELQADRAVLALEHQGPPEQWPFTYEVEISYVLTDRTLLATIRFENTDERPQPVGIGFHPFFPRTQDTILGFEAGSVWLVGEDSLPVERLPVEGDWSFAPARAIGDAALDNCYAGWKGDAVLRWPGRGVGLRISGSEALGHLVVYTPPGRPYFAVEPASTMTDAINRMDVADQGLRVVVPGEGFEVSTVLELFDL